VPSIRAETTRVAHSIGAINSAVGGEAPALYLAALGLAVLLFIFLLALGEDCYREHGHPGRPGAGRHVRVFALAGARTPGGSQFVNLAVGLALGIQMGTFLVRTLLVRQPCCCSAAGTDGRPGWAASPMTAPQAVCGSRKQPR